MRALAHSLAVAVLLVAVLVAAQPHRISGPATAGSGGGGATTTTAAGATTTTPGSTTTSTTTGLVAAWMLDEASGTRADWVGNSAQNLGVSGTGIANDTTNKMEGTAAALFTGATQELATSTSTALRYLPEPFTCVVWARQTGGSGIKEVMFNAGASSGWALEYDATATKYRIALNTPSSVIINAPSTTTVNSWAHLAVVRATGSPGSTTLYVNGASVASTPSVFVTNSGPEFSLGANQSGSSMVGQLDEAGCYAGALSAAGVCRICSCGVRGEQCTCSGTSYTSTGRNASACGSCTLPADCSAGPS